MNPVLGRQISRYEFWIFVRTSIIGLRTSHMRYTRHRVQERLTPWPQWYRIFAFGFLLNAFTENSKVLKKPLLMSSVLPSLNQKVRYSKCFEFDLFLLAAVICMNVVCRTSTRCTAGSGSDNEW